MSTPKRSQSHTDVGENDSENVKIKNGNGTTEEMNKKSPNKGGEYKNFV